MKLSKKEGRLKFSLSFQKGEVPRICNNSITQYFMMKKALVKLSQSSINMLRQSAQH